VDVHKPVHKPAKTARATKLSLIVASENAGAHALYLKLGYQEVASFGEEAKARSTNRTPSISPALLITPICNS
jgi:ribosomal protein S18 acetylase RimI-like enzyme